MNSLFEECIATILEDMVLEKVETSGFSYHGSRKGDELKWFIYYDEYHGVWGTYEKAVEGYILAKLQPVIEGLIK